MRAWDSRGRRGPKSKRAALDAYKRAGEEGKLKASIGDTGYPKSLDDLATGIENASSPDRQKIYFLRRIPRDPMNSDLSLSPAQTWGKRSYASPPDDPKERVDVRQLLRPEPQGDLLLGVLRADPCAVREESAGIRTFLRMLMGTE